MYALHLVRRSVQRVCRDRTWYTCARYVYASVCEYDGLDGRRSTVKHSQVERIK